jgi:hypothetical protein
MDMVLELNILLRGKFFSVWDTCMVALKISGISVLELMFVLKWNFVYIFWGC